MPFLYIVTTPISRPGSPDFDPPRRPEPEGEAPQSAMTPSPQPEPPADLAGLKAWFREDPSPDRQAVLARKLFAMKADSKATSPRAPYDFPYENPAPGHYMIVDRARGIDIRLNVEDPQAKDGVQDVITVTEADSGHLEKGSGSRLVVALLQRYGISLRPGGKLVCTPVTEAGTVHAYTQHMLAKAAANSSTTSSNAAHTKIGHFAAAIVSRLGLEVESIDWPSGSADRIEIIATTRASPPNADER